MRTPVMLGAALLALALAGAAPAQAGMVYVTAPASGAPVIHLASDDGKGARRIGIGRAPTISSDGRWVAYVTIPPRRDRPETVVLQRLDGGSPRPLMRAREIDSVRFSPDSARVAAVLGGRRVGVYDIARDKVRTVARGHIRGYAFSPDGTRIAVGRAAEEPADARSDIWIGRVVGGKPARLTRVRNAIYPVWGATELYFDRFKRRRGAAPALNLWRVPAAGGNPRRLTRLSIPRLLSGLVPLEASADGRRMLAVFTGQDTQVGFTVDTATGRTRALSKDFAAGLVGFDLSADGRTILAHTGGPDPAAAHDVVAVPYGGGKPRVLVRGAAYPDWSR